jgi:hypothetical protein
MRPEAAIVRVLLYEALRLRPYLMLPVYEALSY